MNDLLARGTTLPGNHVLEGTIGNGRVKTVYAAHDAEGRKAAALVLHRDLVEELGEWFENAGILGRTLDHPGLVKTFAVGEVEGRPVMVCEALEGETLAEILARSGATLPFSEVGRIITQLAAALDYLHERSPVIVHRAITPENIFLADPDGRVKLLEVGSHDRPRFTASRPQHRSPEDLAEIGELSPRADVFSLASLAFELLTGQPAFNGDANTVLDAARSGQRKRVSDVREEIAPRVDEVLLRAWSLSPEARHQSAGAFARALAEGLADRTDAPPPKPSQRVPSVPVTPDEAPTGRVRQKILDELNPMGEFPTVKLVVSADGSVAVSPAVGAGSATRSTPPAGRAPLAASKTLPPSVRNTTRAPARSGVQTPLARPSAADPAPAEPLDKDTTARDIPRPPAPAEGVHVDDPTPALDAVIVAVDPTPTAVVLTVPAAPAPAAPSAPASTPAPAVPAASPRAPDLAPASVADSPPPAAASPPTPPAPESARPAPAQPVSARPSPAEPRSPGAWPAVSPDRPVRPADPARGLPGNVPQFALADEPTEAIPIPSFLRSQRSPVVVAAAFLANAIMIVGIAHAIAWSARSQVTPVVLQAPPAVCAPCASCPALPVCPPPPVCAPARAPLVRPPVASPLVRPPVASPLVRPPLARPPLTPARPGFAPTAARPPVARPAAPRMAVPPQLANNPSLQ